MKFHFEFISNYDGVSDYRVYQLGTRINFRISLKNSTKQIKRLCDEIISPELLEAFNDYLLERHIKAVEYCRLKNYEIDFEFTPVTI
jgi:hypothetical protein